MFVHVQERGFVASSAALPTQTSHVDKVGKTGGGFTGMTGMAKASGGERVRGWVEHFHQPYPLLWVEWAVEMHV